MKQGYLSQYFKSIAVKTLSAVEVDSKRSNQHEFNGVASLKDIFGTKRQQFSARFIYVSDYDTNPPKEDGFLTWYDSRKNDKTRTPEYRMYYPKTIVSMSASVGDTLFICLKPDNTILVIVAERGSTIANQISWLFGTSDLGHTGFSFRKDLETEQDRISFTSKIILDELGVDTTENNDAYLDEMLIRFNGGFPSTKDFSAFARSTLSDISPLDNPDTTLMYWMEREEILFRTLEKYLITEYLSSNSFGKERGSKLDIDVNEFIRYSLSVQNRRKSRVGHALENHIEQLFISRNICYSRAKKTELNSKPDFVFPGISEYHDNTFDASLLTMLGVKSSCKDRWRQILSEAMKIPIKHLLTLESAISENQTNEMQHQNLRLVVPSVIGKTFSEKQQKWLMSVSDFIELVLEKQADIQ